MGANPLMQRLSPQSLQTAGLAPSGPRRTALLFPPPAFMSCEGGLSRVAQLLLNCHFLSVMNYVMDMATHIIKLPPRPYRLDPGQEPGLTYFPTGFQNRLPRPFVGLFLRRVHHAQKLAAKNKN